MVSLSLLKLLEINGFGTIDEDLFWEKLGLNENGLYITDLGASQERGGRKSLSYQIYCRGEDDVSTYKKLQAVADFLTNSFSICKLPAVRPVTDYGYDNVTIMPPSAILSLGEDINGRVLYSITGQLYYGEKVEVTEPLPGGKDVLTEGDKLALTEQNKVIKTEE